MRSGPSLSGVAWQNGRLKSLTTPGCLIATMDASQVNVKSIVVLAHIYPSVTRQHR